MFRIRITTAVALTVLFFGCEPVDDTAEPQAGGMAASMGGTAANTMTSSTCLVCQSDAPFFTECSMNEVTSDNERVCIDTDEDILCKTGAECCNEIGLEFDAQGGTCLESSSSGDPVGMVQCSTKDDCPAEFPRCEVDASRSGICTVECRSNDDCASMDGKPFCRGDNRCSATPDGTCQIETPSDPRSADAECVGQFTTCMPLSEGAALGICVECYADVSCLASSNTPQCSTRGICIEASADSSCEADSDCCPTENADCASQRRCNPESKQCETQRP